MSNDALIYHCAKCKSSWHLIGLKLYGHLLKPVMTCPHQPLCTGKARRTLRHNTGVKINAKAFYQACEGLGLPDERGCGPEEVKKVLAGAIVTDFEVEPNGERTVIKFLQLDNTRLYLTASPGGAIVYRMVKHGAR